ncbi:MAG TPA: hypothetical protein VKA46_31200 [Gemmataceae bacterium]|nr:hypothetical protein [Gemmataceae bacterium]
MFGWFRPTCPCDPAAKPWVEDRLRWLTGQFGLHVLLERPVILPTEEYFPDPWDGSPKAAQAMFRRVCEYMGVEPDALELQFFDAKPTSLHALDPSLGIAAGTWSGAEQPWERGVIRIEKGGLDRPADLVGVMAHELAHQRLLGERRADADAFDNELLTDLTAVFHGFGVFLANNPRKSTGQLSHWPGSKLYRPEYLSEPMLGYALAHVAWHRDEASPAWAKALRWAPRAVFGQGLRFLDKTADSSFKPVRLRGARPSDG